MTPLKPASPDGLLDIFFSTVTIEMAYNPREGVELLLNSLPIFITSGAINWSIGVTLSLHCRKAKHV
ncbi:hypothetical protein ELQ35_01715 [Peribacillus cavernae]|uniref:Uncharacterized protein n=1 Tax=Peribacillus cavernae TaxID=1674310 RepID=A0A3S1BCF8_9BACI|nr:hypothetical protein [Peribacillus cavernae]MDQ0221132.1 hypothetical protein [Peribacillus cavernae]RUQ32828.1 hypothetical protein ELQ35_01715 [Peribacillus cavernae]